MATKKKGRGRTATKSAAKKSTARKSAKKSAKKSGGAKRSPARAVKKPAKKPVKPRSTVGASTTPAAPERAFDLLRAWSSSRYSSR